MNKKTALVTGASSGIGACIATKLAQENINVWVNYSRKKEPAEEIVKQIIAQGGQAQSIQADVSVEDSVKQMMAEIKTVSGGLDYLVNNAGIFFTGSFKEFSVADWKKQLEVNLLGKFIVLQAAIPLLEQSPVASVVNISSRLSKLALANVSASCCASAGVVMLTQTAALEL
ncbi:MAG: SDR family NAD(P)-dependent oxidoreductase, partial [Methylococcaceae bacterium]|nr:SDR family NAD(P)-dependent oxidoreductase [Methylococcaceae bacterium]